MLAIPRKPSAAFAASDAVRLEPEESGDELMKEVGGNESKRQIVGVKKHHNKFYNKKKQTFHSIRQREGGRENSVHSAANTLLELGLR